MPKIHTTNYFNAFIQIADDCPVEVGQVPPEKGDRKSVAQMQFEMLAEQPYRYSSDDVLFTVFAQRKDLIEQELAEARKAFFSKGQPCFRASPLTKRYGWGVHSDAEGKIALIARNDPRYDELSENAALAVVKAMKTKR